MALIDKVVFNGRTYRRYNSVKNPHNNMYYRTSGFNETPRYLHRDIYESIYGKIPEGYHIHHIDGDTLNNSIENLEMLLRKDHTHYHYEINIKDPLFREKISENLRRIQSLCNAWHSTKEGIEWHTKQGKEVFNKKPLKSYICVHCGAEYKRRSVRPSSFCSNKCVSADRRYSGKDNENRICIICNKEFVINKYCSNKTCSHRCGGIMFANKRKNNNI
jgi:hypothetical protein